MNYVGWTHRLSQFLRSLTHLPGDIAVTDGIEAAPKHKFTRDWLKSDKCSLPPEVRAFVTTATTRCYFNYRWKPPEASRSAFAGIYPGRLEIEGGADLCCAAGFQNYDNRDWFANLTSMLGELANVDDPERSCGRIPIVKLRNGDQISIVSKNAEPGGAVVYVPAADVRDVRTISRSFDDFLSAWEEIAYVTPTLDNLAPWLDPKTRFLAPAAAVADQLCRVFKVESTGKRRSD